MTSEEKRAWILGSVGIAGYPAYLVLVLLAGVDYVPAMLGTIGTGIVAGILLTIAVTVRGPVEPADERDLAIARFGDNIGGSTVTAGALAALILALLEVDHVWIANVVYLGFVLSAVLGSTAKIAAYRYGLPGRHAW